MLKPHATDACECMQRQNTHARLVQGRLLHLSHDVAGQTQHRFSCSAHTAQNTAS